MTDEEIIRLGHDAGALLESPTFQNVIGTLRTEYMDRIIQSDFDDSKERETYFRMIRAMDLIATELTARYALAEETKRRIEEAERAADPNEEGVI